MRLYTYNHLWLSSLQKGLQSGHVAVEIMIGFEKDSTKGKIAFDWAKNHKTMMLMNGGNTQMLEETYDFFKKLEKEGMCLPFAKFYEDRESLNGCITSVGIVVTEEIYELLEHEQSENEVENWKQELATYIKKSQFAI